MIIGYNYLNDKDFLFNLHASSRQGRKIYAKITVLNKEEYPIEQIQGYIKDGSINIDGLSSVRRTCSLTIAVPELKYTDYIWSLHAKFLLEIGLENTIDNKYPDVIWIPQGIYIISSFSTSINLNSCTINISGKDKMCLLNGDISGTLQDYEIDFSTIEEYDAVNNVTKKRKLTLKEIITNLLMDYGLEKVENIIINDLDDYALELLEYRGDEPIYVYSRQVSSQEHFSNDYINLAYGSSKLFNKNKTFSNLASLASSSDVTWVEKIYNDLDHYYSVKIDGMYYQVKEIEFGMAAGYRVTDLTYAGDLTASIGNSITTILDKIKNMLVHFEYYYNNYGQFVFQRKQSFNNSTWNSINQKNPIVSEYRDIDMAFSNLKLIQSISRTPNLTNVKNDYSIWGKKIKSSGAEKLVHIRFAIDKKPNIYTSIKVTSKDYEEAKLLNPSLDKENFIQSSKTYSSKDYDWREIIYQMAKDYQFYSKYFSDFEYRVLQANIKNGYISGKTGYELYYLDLYSFWRDLYDPQSTEKNFSLQSNNVLHSNTYALGYDKYDEDLSKFLSQSKDKINYNALKIFQYGGMQNYLDVLNAFKLVNEQYWIKLDGNDDTSVAIKDFSKITVKQISNPEIFSKKNNSGKFVSILPNDNVKIYYKSGNGYKECTNTSSLKAYRAYYKTNNSYEPIKTLLKNLGDTNQLYYKKQHLVIDKNSPRVLANKINIEYKDDKTGKLVPWWYAYKNTKIDLYTEKKFTKETQGFEKIEDNDIQKNIYLKSDGKLREYFNSYQYDIFGKVIQSSKQKIPISYYKGINIYYGKTAGEQKYWNKSVRTSPENLDFWFDFLDCSEGIAGDIDKFSVSTIGRKPFSLNASEQADSVFYSGVPNIIFTDKQKKDRVEEENQFTGYKFIYTNQITSNLFSISSRKKSLQEVLDENLFKYSYCSENINITTIPLYYLQPNIKISIQDQKSEIDGIYEINRFSLPFTPGGTSSISAVKYVEQLY